MTRSAAQLEIVPGAAAREEAPKSARSPRATKALEAIADAKRRLAAVMKATKCTAGGLCHFVAAVPPPGSPAGPWTCCDKCRMTWARPDGWRRAP